MLERHEYFYDKPFEFEDGGHLDSMTITYYTSAREYKKGDRVVWVCHALTGNANPEDWWPQMVGPGKMFDPDECFVVCAAMICSAYGSCGPFNVNPATHRPWLLDFPRTSVRDMVRSHIIVREHLGIDSIDVLLGPSIGGFQAVEWAVMEPDVIKTAIFLATDTRVAPMVTAYNESQRMALKADPTFLAAESLEGGREGLKCARSIALISYRTMDGYNLTQSEKDDDTLFADRAGSYQRHQGDKLVARGFDAYSYWYLTYALDSHNVGRGRGGEASALSGIKARTLVCNINTDVLFPSNRAIKSAACIPGAVYRDLPSIFGHDGFLIENDALTAIFKDFFSCQE